MSGRGEKAIETGHVADVGNAPVGIEDAAASNTGRRVQLERANGFPDPIRVRDAQHGVEENMDLSAFDGLAGEHEGEEVCLVSICHHLRLYTTDPNLSCSSGEADARLVLARHVDTLRNCFVPRVREARMKLSQRVMWRIQGNYGMQQDARPVLLTAYGMVIAEHVAGFGDLEAIREVEPLERVAYDRLLRFGQVVLGVLVERGRARVHAPAIQHEGHVHDV